MKKWYVGKTGNEQGLIIDEEAGRNIAVSYDGKDAPLISAAPDMLRALREAVARVEIANSEGDEILSGWLKDARAAIAMAEGR